MSHTILLTNWQRHSAALIHIRTAVFIEEQHISAADEWDALDAQAQHFLVLSAQGAAIGCARLLTETSAGHSLYHIGRVAILGAFRNQGIGHQLMQQVIAYCQRTAPDHRIYLYAQTERRSFYEALNFVAEGDEFMDAGIPHIRMYLGN